MLLDERNQLPDERAYPRVEHVYDGEKILSLYYMRSGKREDLAPKATIIDNEATLSRMQYSGSRLGLECWGEPLPDLLRTRTRVRCLGYQQQGRARCLVLEVHDPKGIHGRCRFWIDLEHGFLLRRVLEYQGRDLRMEMLTSAPREWAPGVFLPTLVTQREFVGRAGRPAAGSKAGVPTHHYTVTVRSVTVGPLPERLFDATPTARQAAFDARTGKRFGERPRRVADRVVAVAADHAKALVIAKSLPARLRLTQEKQEETMAPDMACGPQCLYVLCRELGVRATIGELCQLARTGPEGTSLQGLIEAAQAKGLEAEGRQLSFSDLRQVQMPLIAYASNHFYLVMGFNRTDVVILSPPNQIFTIPERMLRQGWDGRVLLVRRDRSADTSGKP